MSTVDELKKTEVTRQWIKLINSLNNGFKICTLEIILPKTNAEL